MVDLVPADHLAVMLFKDRFQLAVEIRLQRVAVRQLVVAHKLLNGRIRFPLAVILFVVHDFCTRRKIRSDAFQVRGCDLFEFFLTQEILFCDIGKVGLRLNAGLFYCIFLITE